MSPEEKRAYNRAYLVANRAAINEQRRDYYKRNPAKHKEYQRRSDERNKTKRLASRRRYYLQNPVIYLLIAAKDRAKKKGLPFNLTKADIIVPDLCPVLGVPMIRTTPTAPSVDRIRPELGYVRGNVAVISRRANHLKNDGTLAELRAVVAWLEKQ
jgi:hypothetical protein